MEIYESQAKEKYLLAKFRSCLLDKLHTFRQGSLLVSDYTTQFDNLIIHCDVGQDRHRRYRGSIPDCEFNIQQAMHIYSSNVDFLAQACQLAKHIDYLSLSPNALTSKARKQSRPPHENNVKPNTQTTRDPKGKSVIGESSKQDAISVEYFKCHEYGHIAALCPTRNILVEGAQEDDDEFGEEI